VYTLLIIDRLFQINDNPLLSERMGQDVCAILDTQIKPDPQGPLAQSGLQHLLHSLISGEIDVDRMDYLLRDSQKCGVIYGYFDLGRILDSLGFYKDLTTQQFGLAIRKSGVPAFEDYLRARWSMYQQVYFHKTATACEAMLQFLNKQLPITLPLELDEFLKLDEHTFHDFLNKTTAKNPLFQETQEDLFSNRQLWKRIYEERVPIHALRTTPSLCSAVLGYLKDLHVYCELVESTTHLTRFHPLGRNNNSQNSLKVMIKGLDGLRYLEPIENHSKLINRMDEEVVVRQIFVAAHKLPMNLSFSELQHILSCKLVGF